MHVVFTTPRPPRTAPNRVKPDPTRTCAQEVSCCCCEREREASEMERKGTKKQFRNERSSQQTQQRQAQVQVHAGGRSFVVLSCHRTSFSYRCSTLVFVSDVCCNTRCAQVLKFQLPHFRISRCRLVVSFAYYRQTATKLCFYQQNKYK